ncbi:hypothetical protein SeMB42_g07358 [Synchytrium endobioticum]|uniref:Integrase catalytic domain-containing protein n=1 Tax=Synchytrium endobioticum TaxID=286115 RepID=A0A507C9B5_9FUNG|nr:hypothetical protein SeMB42_g07358 [Synchytrium endobioticum]
MKILRSDNGGEYKNGAVEDYVNENGITHQFTIPGNPSQNGIAERYNRTVIQIARALKVTSGLPDGLWLEMVNHANTIRNFCPTRTTGLSPYEAYHGRSPPLDKIYTFGAIVVVHKDGIEPHSKLDSNGVLGVYLGFALMSKGLRIWIPTTNKIIERTKVQASRRSNPCTTTAQHSMSHLSNFINVDLKRTELVSLSSPIKNYIAQTYAHDPELYNDDCRSLDSLRSHVMAIHVHASSLATLQKYHGQLIYLASKFPINDSSIRICFPWYCVFGTDRKSASSFNLSYERACILFNIGALHSQLGLAEPRHTPDGLKRSAIYYQAAAGTFKALQHHIATGDLHVPFVPDFMTTTLTALVNLMLAQAQEAFWQKAVGDKKSDATIAKLAAQVAEYYDAAHYQAASSNVFTQPWLTHLHVKTLHFNAAAQYRKACEAFSTGKYGEEIARLQLAESCVKKASEFHKHLGSAVSNDLKGLQAVLATNLARAEKDNNIIYLDIIPSLENLSPIQKAEMVSPTPVPDLTALTDVVGPPLFAKLVPFAVHQAVSLYATRKEAFVNDQLKRAADATESCHKTLQSLNLPGAIDALEQPIGLPPAVLSRSEQVQRSGGVAGLSSQYETLLSLAKADSLLLDEALKALDNEAKDDDEARQQFKDRWTRTPSRDLTANLRDTAKMYRDKLDMATSSDRLVKAKIDTNFAVMTALSSSKDELEASIPSSTTATTIALKDSNIKEIKSLLNQLNDTIKAREQVLGELKHFSTADDIAPRLIEATSKQVQLDNQALFDEHLRKYDPIVTQISQSVQAQNNLLEAVQAAHQRFMNSRQTNNMISLRETALQNLETAYRTFKEISGNLQEGVKFYTDIQNALTRFRDNCCDFAFARGIDRRDNLNAIQSVIAGFDVADPLNNKTSKNPSLPVPPRPATATYSNNSNLHNNMPPPGIWNSNQGLNYASHAPHASPPPFNPAMPGAFTYSNQPPAGDIPPPIAPGGYRPYLP